MSGNPPITSEKENHMYTRTNFKTKKAFKQAVEAWNDTVANVDDHPVGVPYAPPVTYFQPGPFGGNEPRDGVLYFEGPHYPQPHRWYAQAVAKDGVIVKVK
jgi:hypothetical protein